VFNRARFVGKLDHRIADDTLAVCLLKTSSIGWRICQSCGSQFIQLVSVQCVSLGYIR